MPVLPPLTVCVPQAAVWDRSPTWTCITGAQASAATLTLRCWGDARPGAPLRIDWSASDDGVGLPDAVAVSLRGKGIAGIQARVWSQGGELRCEPLQAGSASPGLRLSASFSSAWQAESVLRETSA